MNKKEFTAEIADRTGTTLKAAAEAVDAFFGAISDTVAAGEPVTITGFGKFDSPTRPERQSRNPATGQRITVPATRVPRFKAGAALKAAVRGER